ncbi:conserved protein of unknown function [Candidatus Promineifilum breve]|uniref:Uncharacterized protein n=1 Tax=Candidatus Promineifilum breve TaxID=1806508 RepID=A0A160T693_9CHLR|nr:hypothetical protein [Candidatus Promineifilum breve]CUS05856.1 conserved protein of unknown function [Candidatus Promineifilum breve]
MIDRNTFTVEEWAQIIAVPASVGALVVTADPSGPIGLLNEFQAIMKSMKKYVDAHAAASPLMAAFQSYMATKPSQEEEAELKQWAETQQAEMKTDRPQNPEEMKQYVRDKVGESLTTLRAKGADEADVSAFKAMMIAVAEATAAASKEGGFLGFGGVRVSEAEQSVLDQIKAELSA